jgi:hypothetical protein
MVTPGSGRAGGQDNKKSGRAGQAMPLSLEMILLAHNALTCEFDKIAADVHRA